VGSGVDDSARHQRAGHTGEDATGGSGARRVTWVTGSPPPGSERQRLRPPVHLGPTVLRHRLDRRAGQAVVGREQPANRLRLIEATVEKEGERAVQSLEDLVTVQERGGHAQGAVRPPQRYQLAVTEELLDPAGRDAEAVSDLGQVETGADQ